MAALGEADRQAILGSDYRDAQMRADEVNGVEREERSVRTEIDRLDGHKFTALALSLMGLALMLSAHITATGLQYWIQGAIGLVLVVGGGAFYLRIRSRLPALIARAEALHAEHR